MLALLRRSLRPSSRPSPRTRAKPVRKPLRPNQPRDEIELVRPELERDPDAFAMIGTERREVLERRPARRSIFKALESDPERAKAAFAWIGAIFALERSMTSTLSCSRTIAIIWSDLDGASISAVGRLANICHMSSSRRGTGLSILRWPFALLFQLLFVQGNWASELPEYDIKAAYLFNFAKFVEWPPRSFASPSAPMVIGILGSDPFGGRLDRIAGGEVVGGHKLAVRYSRTLEGLKGCHILFIPKAESDRVEEALAAVRGGGVLTVGDSADFVSQGGMIGFIMAGQSVRFQINAGAAQKEGLAISSRLLRLGV